MLLTMLVRPGPGPNLLYHFGHPHNLLEWVIYVAVMGAFIGITLFVALATPGRIRLTAAISSRALSAVA
jgi:hypothetical protein